MDGEGLGQRGERPGVVAGVWPRGPELAVPASSSARRSCVSISIRRRSRARVASLKSSTRSLPASLAWYIAESASRSSASGSASPGAAMRAPMLTRTWRRWPATSKGGESAARRRPAVTVASVWSSTPSAEHGELVAAEPGDQVLLADGAAQALGDLDQQPVAGLVAEAVVDDLEVVEVEEEDGDALARVGGPLQRGDERGAVRQAGESVEPGCGMEDERGHGCFINRPAAPNLNALGTLSPGRSDSEVPVKGAPAWLLASQHAPAARSAPSAGAAGSRRWRASA